MLKKLTAILCLCGILMLTGCTIPTNSSASVMTATSITDEVVIVRSYEDTNEYIGKIIIKRLTKQYKHYKERGYLKCPNKGFEYNWDCMLDDMLSGIENPTVSNYGYAFKDINGDGVDELFFMRSDNIIYSIFTFSLDNTVMLDTYYSNRECRILKDGSILTVIRNGNNHTTYNISTLPEKGTILRNNVSYSFREGYYYKIVGDKHEAISKETFEQFISNLPVSNDYKLEFIPYSSDK